MTALQLQTPSLPAMTPEAIGQVKELGDASLRFLPQHALETHHLLHGGMYARTLHLPVGCLITGVLIKISTTLVVCGDVSVFTGEDTVRMQGYYVLPGSAGRSQAFLAHAPTSMTMLFPSDASTVEEAERQFTDDGHLLESRRSDKNYVTITGEKQ